ncbi:hypothetical protein HKD37_18G050932 [Glycine soja]
MGMLGNGYEPGMGLGKDNGGRTSLISARGNRGKFGLGYILTPVDIRKSVTGRKSRGQGSRLGREVEGDPPCHISRSFISADDSPSGSDDESLEGTNTWDPTIGFEQETDQTKDEENEDVGLPPELEKIVAHEDQEMGPHQEETELVDLGTGSGKKEAHLGGEAPSSMAYYLVDGASSHLFSFVFRCISMLKDPTSIKAPQASFHQVVIRAQELQPFLKFQELSPSPTTTISHHKPSLFSTPRGTLQLKRNLPTWLAVSRLVWNRQARTKKESSSDATRNPGEMKREKHASYSSHNSCKSLSEELRDYYEGRHRSHLRPHSPRREKERKPQEANINLSYFHGKDNVEANLDWEIRVEQQLKKKSTSKSYGSHSYPKKDQGQGILVVTPSKPKDDKGKTIEKQAPKASMQEKTSSIKGFKCLGRGHITSQCPTTKTMIMRGQDIYSSQDKATTSPSSSESEKAKGEESSEEMYPLEEGQPLVVKEKCKEVSVSSKRLAKKETHFTIKTKIKETFPLRQPPHFLFCKKTLASIATPLGLEFIPQVKKLLDEGLVHKSLNPCALLVPKIGVEGRSPEYEEPRDLSILPSFLSKAHLGGEAPSSMAYSPVDGASSHLFSFVFRCISIVSDLLDNSETSSRAFSLYNVLSLIKGLDVTSLKELGRLMGPLQRQAFRKVYGKILDLTTVDVFTEAVVSLAQYYDQSLRCFTFGDFQILLTVEEFEEIIGCLLGGRKPYLFSGFLPSLSKIAAVVGDSARELDRMKQTRNGVVGLPQKYLEGKARDMASQEEWVPFADILALLIFGVVLFPNVDGLVDLAAIDAFLAYHRSKESLVVAILVDLFHTFDRRCEKNNAQIVCCLPALCVWLVSHLFQQDIRHPCPLQSYRSCVEKRRVDWDQYLAGIGGNIINWFPRWKEGKEGVLFSCGDYPNVPLIGTRGCINYNPALAIRQLGYPMRGAPTEESLSPFLVRDFGAQSFKIVHRVHKAWESLLRKVKELRGIRNGIIGGYHEWLRVHTRGLDWLSKLKIINEENFKASEEDEETSQIKIQVSRYRHPEKVCRGGVSWLLKIQEEFGPTLRSHGAKHASYNRAVQRRVKPLVEDFAQAYAEKEARGKVIDALHQEATMWMDRFALNLNGSHDLPRLLAKAKAIAEVCSAPEEIHGLINYCQHMIDLMAHIIRNHLVFAGERIESGLRKGKFEYASNAAPNNNRRAPVVGTRKKEGDTHAVTTTPTWMKTPQNAQNSYQHNHPNFSIRAGSSLPTQLWPSLLENHLVVAIPRKVFQPPYPKWYNSNVTCAYHSGAPGHNIDSCLPFKYKVQHLINVGWLSFQEEGPNVKTNPLASHGGASVNAIEKDRLSGSKRLEDVATSRRFIYQSLQAACMVSRGGGESDECLFHLVESHDMETCPAVEELLQRLMDCGQLEVSEGDREEPQICMHSAERKIPPTPKSLVICFTRNVTNSGSKYPLTVPKPTPFSYQSNKVVPWKYTPPAFGERAATEVDSLSAKVTNITGLSGITRSGRVFAPPHSAELPSKGKAPMIQEPADVATPSKEVDPPVVKGAEKKEGLQGKAVTLEEAHEFLRLIQQREFKVVEQLNKTLARISLLELLINSEPHRALLVKVLNEAHVAHDISVEGFEDIVNHITTNNYIALAEEEIPVEGRGQNKALHVSIRCMDHAVAKVLIDNGSSLNVMPKTTLEKLPFNASRLKPSSMSAGGDWGNRHPHLDRPPHLQCGFSSDGHKSCLQLSFGETLDSRARSVVATYPSAGGRRETRGMRVPRKEYARSRHQRLFEENVGKTGKDAVYELLSERFGSCIYARGSKIGEVVAAQLAQASSARPGEQGCFLQKQPPSGGIFWRAQVGLGAICTPIFTKYTPLCCFLVILFSMTKLGLCLSSGPPPLDDKRVRITIRMTKLGLCLSSGPPPLDDKRVRITIRMTKLGLCLSSGPPPLDDKRVRITIRMTKLGLCLSSGPPPLDDKRVRITIRMTKLGLCLSSGPPPLDDKRVRITIRMTKLGLCLSSGPPPLDDKRVRITIRMTKLGLCLSSGPPPLDDKRVRITIRMTKLGLCLSSGPPPLDDKRVRITIRMTKLGLCLSSGPPPLDDKRVRITIRMTKLGLCLSSGPPPLDDKRVRITIRMTKFGLCLSSGPPPLDDKRVRITIRMTKFGLCLSSGPPPLDDKRVRITIRYLRVSWVQNDQTWSLLVIGPAASG